MKMIIQCCLLAISLVFTSCSGSKTPTKSKEIMSVNELVSAKGEPLSKTTNTINSNFDMYEYSNNERYQVEGEKVISQFSDPSFDESSIQYWRHKLADKTYEIVADESAGEHNNSQKLICDECGLTILFNSSGTVKRVIRYAGGSNE